MSQLAALYGEENVYAGYAADATIPYVTYTLQPGSPAEYHTADHNQGTLTTYPIMFSVWSESDLTAITRIEEIVQAFEDSFPEMENDICEKVEKISEYIEQDPDQDETGPEIWRGICIIEFTIARGR